MTVYDPNNCALIYRTSEPFGELSNMHNGFPIDWGGRLWKSSEALYQALRFPDDSEKHDAINAASNAFLAKIEAYTFKDETRSDWQEVKIPTMEMVLRLKLEQHYTKISSILMQTKGLIIVEKSKRDDFWGAIPQNNGTLVGENVLGVLWTIVGHDIISS